MSRSVWVTAARGFVAGVALAFLIPMLLLTSAHAAAAETCSLAVLHCKQQAMRHTDSGEKCAAAGEQCKRSGTFIGPYTGKVIHGFVRQ